MTQIEHREVHIKHIHAQTTGQRKEDIEHEQVAVNASIHHCIGLSENLPERIGHFTAQHSGDPAVKVSCVILLDHLLIND
jgi:hypothetical protein